ncbi:Thioredoxin [Oceanobacillus picturae]|uniref:Thioredoxin n=1 Tax=Oceanobacillus picturae TaxID=171693 RepID=W9AB75_9BACI|nr:thioredoxin family protein [Oceanobacillus picturae]AVQ98601.1 thiol reductase thioredoxin [Oceanobacillus iheyensis]RIU90674.1 thioredoxin [Oceanobacillus picturae]CDO02723.1 Thioredoxin [Oceanobacillus picturae]
MQKKILVFVGVIVLLFAGLYFVIDYKNNQTVENNDNPYGDKKLEQSTIDQLDDPNYGNQIMPDELSEQVESGEAVTVYFYNPECVHCQNTTPYLVPLAEDNNVDMKKMNLLEFKDQWNVYGIESTPTLIHFENGEEQGRIVGQVPEENFQQFFDQYVIK